MEKFDWNDHLWITECPYTDVVVGESDTVVSDDDKLTYIVEFTRGKESVFLYTETKGDGHRQGRGITLTKEHLPFLKQLVADLEEVTKK
ncbi:hypothetical protein BSI_44090 [Bacillus inaquosorum KCTC 13429]|uniref:Uncharacterized protein n=1 Tax=Bacillus inaquosorum KCTC 13429 TaxID=1236548 RepID=A0A9W5LE73_9BACI|nr:hypothetical protein [Bacillus inaquosorum]ELS59095.1 hypothetical protein BSI_44090 [Bacillus inaquosorum KCTC 13429]